jgi:hypothetical protein
VVNKRASETKYSIQITFIKLFYSKDVFIELGEY